jgi:hypothetical protein
MKEGLVKIAYGALLAILAALVATSYGLYLRTDGKQNQATLALVLATSVIASIIGFVFAYGGLKGNVTAQLQFFIPILVLVLLPTCIISATVSANQLYGLREAIAAGRAT